MNEELMNNADACYQLAEQKATEYFRTLQAQVKEKSYVETLTEDFQAWKHEHIRHPFLSLFSRQKGKPTSKEYEKYIQWLNYRGKLEPYLDRSISYIYMRDLGKSLESADTQKRVQRTVAYLKKHLTSAKENKGFSMADLYRWAQKEEVESTVIWLVSKLKKVTKMIPDGMDAEHAQRKLIKIIGGVMIHAYEEMEEGQGLSRDKRREKLASALKLGYSYGLTYPFIDDLLDANILSEDEERRYTDLIRSTLITGIVPKLGVWKGKNANLIRFIHSELREAFEYIRSNQNQETLKSFYEESYIFFHSQEVDRNKDLSNATYKNEEIFIPVILKSSSSRLIVRSVIGASEDEGFDKRTFFYGIYNQLADDLADMFDDFKEGAVTPYTYYLKHHKTRSDLINPFELYWTVISYLIHHVYHSNLKTKEVILNRAINGLKRLREKLGNQRYQEVMDPFASGIPEFNKMVQLMVRKGDDVDFFDKLLRDHIITTLRNDRSEQDNFLDTIKTVRHQVNNLLSITKNETLPLIEEPIIDAANYSLMGDGKRLRPIMTWVLGIDHYGLDESAIVPLLRSLEYMHTASLIFDDLPSQDNASTRRGRPTLHHVHNTAIAELTGLFLTQKAVEEQASLDQFDSKSVLKLVQYSARTTTKICNGQVMDLESKGKSLTLEQLNTMCFYKTGIAFEASLIMPAILSQANQEELEALKKFSYHAGIAFQIKDDLLDVEGDQNILGKPSGKDAVNKNATFVSIMGMEGAKKAMWEHYCQGMEVLNEIPLKTPFLKHLLNYIVNRDY
ncbi:polyprenyl synthetase family protein [Mesobacillus maritimus]|uniref:Polyprenyl synthetase family protein n=1 Tax=Mesobacillus maritimus TaxID=1643336 RepID=A0ABS7K6I8_9BACI|nr:polyprenyl synthetase family protein [Mesobacillus maritimus]MBY0097886.1 polyprenyl synthetase family protein [Mesobacillus maritimus]